MTLRQTITNSKAPAWWHFEREREKERERERERKREREKESERESERELHYSGFMQVNKPK